MADPTRSGTIDRGDADFANGEYTVRTAKQKQANVNPAHLEGMKFHSEFKQPITEISGPTRQNTPVLQPAEPVSGSA